MQYAIHTGVYGKVREKVSVTGEPACSSRLNLHRSCAWLLVGTFRHTHTFIHPTPIISTVAPHSNTSSCVPNETIAMETGSGFTHYGSDHDATKQRLSHTRYCVFGQVQPCLCVVRSIQDHLGNSTESKSKFWSCFSCQVHPCIRRIMGWSGDTVI